MFRLTYDGKHYYLFEEVTSPNLAYYFGHTNEFHLHRQIELREGEPSPDEWDANHNWGIPGKSYEKI